MGCGFCGVMVYPDAHVIANHDVTLSDRGAKWFSRDFGVVVHECDLSRLSADLIAEAESVVQA